MKELTDHLQTMIEEVKDLDVKMREFRTGLRQQVDSILSAPPPRSLFPKRVDVLAPQLDVGGREAEGETQVTGKGTLV